MSYKTKSVCILLCGLLITILSYVLSYTAKHSDVMKTELQKLDTLAEIIRTKSLGTNIHYLTTLSERQEIKSALLKPIPEKPYNELSSLLTTVQVVTDTALIYIMNSDGVTLASNWYGHQAQSLFRKNYSFRPYFIEAFSRNAVVYPALGVTTNKRGIYFSKVVYLQGSGSRILGVVVIKDDLHHIDKLLREESSPVFLTVSPGVVFASRDREYLFKLIEPLSKQEHQQIIDSKQFAEQPLDTFEIDGRNSEVTFENEKYWLIKKHFIFPQETAHPGIKTNKWGLYKLVKPSFTTFSPSIIVWPLIALLATITSLILIITKNRTYSINTSLTIAQKKISEQALETDQIFNSSTSGVRLIQSDFTVARVNDTLCAMAGKTREDMIGKKCYEGISCELCHTDKCPLISFSTTRHYKENDSISHVSDSIKQHISVSATKFTDCNNQTVGIIEEFRNIDERKKTEDELYKQKEKAEVANKAKSDFLANISHEIRTPLHAIIGMTELLQESTPTKEQKEYLNYLSNGNRCLQNIINDILDFAKIESKSVFIDEIDFDLELLIRNSLSEFHPRAQSKNIELNCFFYVEVGFYQGDPSRIKQVINHLIDNAIKFTNEGNITLTVSIRDKGIINDTISIQISDTGIGMDEIQLEKAFDQFVQGSPGINKKYEGTGLGLSICKELVKLMHGELRLSSTTHVGTTAYLDFPLKSVTEFNIQPQPLLLSSVEYKCLIVSSSINKSSQEQQCLNNTGFICIEVETIDKALELLGKDLFDVIIIDSTDALDKTHNNLTDSTILLTGFPKLVKIAISSIPFIGEGTLFRNSGFDGYIPRPYQSANLEEAVRNALSLKQSLQQTFVTTHFLREQKRINNSSTKEYYYESNIEKEDYLNLSIFAPLINSLDNNKTQYAEELLDSLLSSIDQLIEVFSDQKSCLNLKKSDTIQSLKTTAICLGANKITTWCNYALEANGECMKKIKLLQNIRYEYETHRVQLLQAALINEDNDE